MDSKTPPEMVFDCLQLFRWNAIASSCLATQQPELVLKISSTIVQVSSFNIPFNILETVDLCTCDDSRSIFLCCICIHPKPLELHDAFLFLCFRLLLFLMPISELWTNSSIFAQRHACVDSRLILNTPKSIQYHYMILK